MWDGEKMLESMLMGPKQSNIHNYINYIRVGTAKTGNLNYKILYFWISSFPGLTNL